MRALLLALALTAPAEPLQRLATADEVAAAVKPAGKPRLVHFWALWCAPCIEELPRQVALAKKARARGAEVLFVSADGFDKLAEIEAHLDALKARAPARHAVLSSEIDPEELTKRIDPRWYGALPATFLFGADGAVRHRVLGPIDDLEEARLLEAIGGKPANAGKRRAKQSPDGAPGR